MKQIIDAWQDPIGASILLGKANPQDRTITIHVGLLEWGLWGVSAHFGERFMHLSTWVLREDAATSAVEFYNLVKASTGGFTMGIQT